MYVAADDVVLRRLVEQAPACPERATLMWQGFRSAMGDSKDATSVT